MSAAVLRADARCLPLPDASVDLIVTSPPYFGLRSYTDGGGRHGITADLSADYCRLDAWRTSDPGERARAMQVPKPPPIPEGMDALFEMAP